MIPLGAVASKAGKFGPYILKLAPALKIAQTKKATGGIRKAIENALKAAGSDADFDDALEATRKFVKLYDKARSLPGLNGLDELAGDWVDPLRKAIETFETEAADDGDWRDEFRWSEPDPKPKPEPGPKVTESPTVEQRKYLVPGTNPEKDLAPAPGRTWKNDVPVGDQSDWDTVPDPGYSPDAGVHEGSIIKEDKLAPIIIDFNQLRKQELNESFLAMFGGWIQRILKSMFGDVSLPVSIRGNQREVTSFARALGGEKAYLQSAKKHGLDHPTTYKNRAKLDNAIKGFEKDTGLRWPFK